MYHSVTVAESSCLSGVLVVCTKGVCYVQKHCSIAFYTLLSWVVGGMQCKGSSILVIVGAVFVERLCGGTSEWRHC